MNTNTQHHDLTSVWCDLLLVSLTAAIPQQHSSFCPSGEEILPEKQWLCCCVSAWLQMEDNCDSCWTGIVPHCCIAQEE